MRGAADDLGLTSRARAEYLRRLKHTFAEGCAIFGPAEAARLFRDLAKSATKGTRPKPPRKRKGPHDPSGDRDLVDLWRYGGWKTKRAFAKDAMKNHSVKIRGKSRPQGENLRDSLIRRLNRALERETIRKRT